MQTANPHEQLVKFVLEQSATQPVPMRVALYRSLAEIVGHSGDTQKLNALANELEKAEAHCAEFTFQFSQPKGTGK